MDYIILIILELHASLAPGLSCAAVFVSRHGRPGVNRTGVHSQCGVPHGAGPPPSVLRITIESSQPLTCRMMNTLQPWNATVQRGDPGPYHFQQVAAPTYRNTKRALPWLRFARRETVGGMALRKLYTYLGRYDARAESSHAESVHAACVSPSGMVPRWLSRPPA